MLLITHFVSYYLFLIFRFMIYQLKVMMKFTPVPTPLTPSCTPLSAVLDRVTVYRMPVLLRVKIP